MFVAIDRISRIAVAIVRCCAMFGYAMFDVASSMMFVASMLPRDVACRVDGDRILEMFVADVCDRCCVLMVMMMLRARRCVVLCLMLRHVLFDDDVVLMMMLRASMLRVACDDDDVACLRACSCCVR